MDGYDRVMNCQIWARAIVWSSDVDVEHRNWAIDIHSGTLINARIFNLSYFIGGDLIGDKGDCNFGKNHKPVIWSLQISMDNLIFGFSGFDTRYYWWMKMLGQCFYFRWRSPISLTTLIIMMMHMNYVFAQISSTFAIVSKMVMFYTGHRYPIWPVIIVRTTNDLMMNIYFRFVSWLSRFSRKCQESCDDVHWFELIVIWRNTR